MLDNNLKVLLISSLPPPVGGISTWTKQYIKYFDRNGLCIDLVNTAVIGKRAERMNSRIIVLDEFIRTKAIITELKEKISRFQPSIIHLNTSCGKYGIIRDFIIASIARSKKVAVVVHFHCNIENHIKNKRALWIFKSLIKRASEIFVLNKASKEFININCHRKAIVIPNYISEDWVSKQPKIIKDTIQTIVFIGHIRFEKGIQDIIDIARLLPKKKFILAGKMMYEKSKFAELENVELLGEIDNKNVRELLDNTDLFLFPTKSEGFSISLLEAMARGVPIITTPVGANLEMIENEGGVIVNTGDIRSMIESIERLENKEIRKYMSDWNVEKVKRTYSMTSVMNYILNEYKRLIIY